MAMTKESMGATVPGSQKTPDDPPDEQQGIPLVHSLKLPVTGPLPEPQSLVEAAATLKAERLVAKPNLLEVTLRCSENTSVCPRTGQPDYWIAEITYRPDQYIIESKALKFYLWAYRNQGILCESLAPAIARDVSRAVSEAFRVRVAVSVTQQSRGGISITAKGRHG